MDSGCALCAKTAIKTFTYWKLIPNEFPYDLIASTHEMLVPLRHSTEQDLNADELQEFQSIKATDLQTYDYLVEATMKTKSIPQHFHLHLLIGKPLGE